MDFDWKKTLPFIGAIATGNIPGLVMAAASAIGEATGNPVDPTAAGIDLAIKNATPEQMAAIQKIDSDLKIRMRELDTEDKKIAVDLEKTEIADVGNAREHNSNSQGVLILGYIINVFSYACIFSILYGCFVVITGTAVLKGIDPGMAATIGTVIGAVVQWLMSNAQQANGFFFGSSPGSRNTSSALAKAVGDAVSRVK